MIWCGLVNLSVGAESVLNWQLEGTAEIVATQCVIAFILLQVLSAKGKSRMRGKMYGLFFIILPLSCFSEKVQRNIHPEQGNRFVMWRFVDAWQSTILWTIINEL